MTHRRSNALHLTLLIACLAVIPACSRDPASPAGDSAATATDDGFIARTTRQALESARKEIAEGNISVGGRGGGVMQINGTTIGGKGSRTAHLPKAEISPAGDLLIGGEPVAVDAAQRQLLLTHRANIVAIAEAGITIGLQGAQLGIDAARGAITSLLSGASAEFEARMEAEGEKMEAEAQTLCDLMPALLASQQSLAEALPAFAPYATIDAADIDDCRDRGDGEARQAGHDDGASLGRPARGAGNSNDDASAGPPAGAAVTADESRMNEAAEADAAADAATR